MQYKLFYIIFIYIIFYNNYYLYIYHTKSLKPLGKSQDSKTQVYNITYV